MAADTISGFIQGLLDGMEFKQTAYALDRDSRQAALARFRQKAAGTDAEFVGEEQRLVAWCQSRHARPQERIATAIGQSW